ncbi:quinoprotein dehydrogenase-associated putative ABC transporter substrate-binding protein [Sphingomonas sp. ID1715]|uniref:quinoprotein dehydrogenase-associated putative ABC transporter substrate-binding protein n=1 Tax=Sphingomonas sp. ID1715 TaxID=1656898 RepID=UPI001488A3A1|nr:quinoprotein dehydrogenase-associated putative ABC transporter substrate-binding protein [Sphingomonas sp. ID1715]NNM76272.1 quinoprotein dehydrogenase-associated putative ABC transporter substrate-binding protein [Sphingomonas sp. ID1715]
MGRRGLALILVLVAAPLQARELRVCADPNNLPFSNDRREGFENKLIEMAAADLAASVNYVWRAQRRGNVRETLNAGLCDVIPGIGASLEMLATTIPYYRSSYMFVTRADRQLSLACFDDERLRELKIGVQLVGDDGANTPPAHALSRRGIVGNVRGFLIYGDYRSTTPQSPIIDAVVRGEVDVAIAWGPVAGWFAARSPVPLRLTPTPPLDGPRLPMTFEVSMGVHKEDQSLRRELNGWIAKNESRIAALLQSQSIPVITQ